MAEPLGVAFIEIEPIAPGFRAKTEAQVRSQLAGVSAGIPPSPKTAAATTQIQAHAAASRNAATANVALAETEVAAAAAADRQAAAELRAAEATGAHASASRVAAHGIAHHAGAMSGLGVATTGLPAPLLAAAAAATILFQSLEEADKFNEAMHQIESATGAAEEELDRAAEHAIALGAALDLPLTTASEAAEAINLLARSGFDLEDAMTASRGALLLTAASGGELKQSVHDIDQILDAFNLTASDSVQVADTLATGMKFTQGNAAEFAAALARIAPIADSMGLSLESTAGLVLQLSESGVSATAGAGQLRQALLKLASVKPLSPQADALDRVGLSVAKLRDESGRLRPDAFVILADALNQVSEAERLRILTTVFGNRSAVSAIRLIDQQRAGYERMAAAAKDTGVALEEGEARTKSFGGKLDETKDDAADFGRQLGSLVDGPATEFVGIFGEMFQALNNFAFLIDTGVGKLGDLAGAIGDAIPFANELADIIKERFDPRNLAPVALTKSFNFLVGLFRGSEKEGGNAFKGLGATVKEVVDGLIADLNRAANALERTTRAAQGPSLAGQLAVAQATGTQGDELAILRQQQAKRQADLARKQARFKAGDVNEQAVTNAANALAQTNAQIETILASMAAETAAAASDAKSRADQIERAASDRDRQFIRAIEATLTGRRDAVTVAAQDEPLQNDIKANITLRNKITEFIASTKARIAEVRAAGHDTQALADELGNLRRDRRQVLAAIAGLRADAAEQANATRIESAQLDLQILEARTGDDPTRAQTDSLVAAHRRVITALKKAQTLAKGRTIEVKRLQLQIEQEQAAIRDLRKTTQKDGGDPAAFQKRAFEFLQTLHGFSSNLATNLLLPGGGVTPRPAAPTATTTAVATPPAFRGPFEQKPTTSADLTPKGVTTGQGNVQITLLRQILSEMRKVNGTTAHPEAANQRAWGATAGSTTYQGTQGM